ncbi:GntR family transcriptional regulator [Lactobacillus sp. UCMA15818]|uniref:GntR family transcriptional regulator n=1 Tax=Lactobacillus sp. UCMA15818 TaxID=2583394 RepID=UPI0025AF03FC|nr:GntR family transcriptional regulator [Lactobacillus sp. UCMA15818]MDN2454128.1 GntR family transcriptional regulator [Lactobacillus sp. UCMA15818]
MLNTSLNLHDQAYKIILEKILTADYEPGQKISEKEISEELGIGRTPVREAILRLRQEGLINVIPQSGTYVTKIDLKVATSARFIRESIETNVIREIALKKDITTDQLHIIIDNQRYFSKQKQFEKFFTEDEDFHREFYVLSGHSQVWEWLQTINTQLNRFRILRLKVAKLPWETLIQEHEDLLSAVETHNVDVATTLISNHLHLMLDEEKTLIQAFPDYFSNY